MGANRPQVDVLAAPAPHTMTLNVHVGPTIELASDGARHPPTPAATSSRQGLSPGVPQPRPQARPPLAPTMLALQPRPSRSPTTTNTRARTGANIHTQPCQPHPAAENGASSCSPRSSKATPEPATMSFTVLDTSTSP